MKKFNFLCSIIVVLTLAIFIVTLGQNMILRSTAAYTYYFNDTGLVSKVTYEFTNSKMSGEIADFMNSWRPEKFQVQEDTGYDMEDVFDDKDSDVMMAVKRAGDISFLICIVCFVLTLSIYVYFLKRGYKQVLRKRMALSMVFAVLLLAGETVLLKTSQGIALVRKFIGIGKVSDESALETLLGGDFIDTASNFALGATLIVAGIILYFTLVLTKQKKIFF